MGNMNYVFTEKGGISMDQKVVKGTMYDSNQEIIIFDQSTEFT